ncbi:hypothetical protein SCUCBS95973_008204 [Sporothrix curviconia]|uniref:Cyclin N-terminal domain-containing protein n=1 Tax=Sporothrix curviconia TaxID=1260050 RepID=A0ABP0CM45_9PEZI
MEMADVPVLQDLGCQALATAEKTQTAQTAQTTQTTKPAPSSTPRTTAMDDEDLFLSDDVAGMDADVDVDADADEDDFDEDDFDDDYFSSTYRPLSNLPTPPPSSHTSLAHSPATDAANGSVHGDLGAPSVLLGPAVHLVNMLPPAASLATPSVALVQAMLTRAQLPLETVALAVCILDSLDSRFARTWRLTCPLGAPCPSSPSSLSLPSSEAAPTTPSDKRHTLPSPLALSFPSFAPDSNVDRLLHIDAVFPEVIILAALVIAAKFTDDGVASQQPAQAYCSAWGSSTTSTTASPSSPSTGPGPCALWTGAQLAATERCIMQNLGYRILPLLDADLLADAQADMHRAGVQALQSRARAGSVAAKATDRPKAAKKAIMTPPEEALGLGLGLGLGLLQLAPPATASTTASATTASPNIGSLDKADRITLKLPPQVQRRHHVSSHSECFGRFAAYGQ